MSTPTSTVTIQAIGPAASLSKTAPSVKVGTLVQLQTTALDANGLASGQNVKITSSDTTVAQIQSASELGYANAAVLAVSPGVATITATASDNSAATATITVTVT